MTAGPRRQRGASSVEYLIIFVLLVLSAIAVFKVLAGKAAPPRPESAEPR